LLIGLVRAEARGAGASTDEAEIRRLFGEGFALTVCRAGDPRAYDEAEELLGRIEDARQRLAAGGGRSG
jgi:hypothetical protein